MMPSMAAVAASPGRSNDIKILNGLTIAVVLAGTAVSVAGPAGADDPNGTYHYLNDAGMHTLTWTASPCGPACIDVAATRGPAAGFPSNTFNAQAQRDGNRWTMTVTTHNEDTCFDFEEGSNPWDSQFLLAYSKTTIFAWDGETLAGSVTETTDYAYEDLPPLDNCWNGSDGTSGPYPFTLTKA